MRPLKDHQESHPPTEFLQAIVARALGRDAKPRALSFSEWQEKKIAELLKTSRYDPAILEQLEPYVTAQCTGGTYDLDANLAVLKLYQFHPEFNNVPVVVRILLKALMNLPATDYLMCTCLIPDRVHELEVVGSVAKLAGLLECCSFREFWKELEPMRADVLAERPAGFVDAIREFSLTTLAITDQAVPEAHLLDSLKVDGGIAKLAASRGWAVEAGTVKVPLNDDNTAKPRKPEEIDTQAMRQDQM